MIGKEKLVFDTAATLVDNDNVGAYLRASDGTLITHTTDGIHERIDTNTGVEYARASAAGGSDRGSFALAVDNANNYAPLRVNASGELLVDASITTGADKVEDAASASGDTGSYVLSVRQDTLAGSTSTDGDYQSFKTDSVGSLWVRLSQGVALDAPNTAIATAAVTAVEAGIAIPTANLAARKKVLFQNLGNNPIFVGGSSVTISNGIRIAAGGNWEVEAGPAIAFKAITAAGKTSDVRVFEIS